MKTTVELPDELVRALKLRAVMENRRLKDVMADLIRRGLAQPAADAPAHRVRLPLVTGGRPAKSGEEATAEQVAAELLEQEADVILGRLH